ncbi:MAG: sigma-70 family RNA polymerase sigma factor [Clostridia bacterium]
MHSENYTKGLKISRNHKKRKIEETEELYAIIKQAVKKARDTESKDSEKSMQFLIELYTPFISSIAFNLFKKISGSSEFLDVKQEVCLNFISLVYKYDETKSEFSYYIRKMLPKYMIKWINKEMLYNTRMSPFTYNTDLLYDMPTTQESGVEDHLDNYIINKEYIEFIQKKSEEKSKSTTNKEVCLNYFLGPDSISTIAKRLEISYHAVYQKINSIKEDTKEFFHDNMFCGYKITSTGLIPI